MRDPNYDQHKASLPCILIIASLSSHLSSLVSMPNAGHIYFTFLVVIFIVYSHGCRHMAIMFVLYK